MELYPILPETPTGFGRQCKQCKNEYTKQWRLKPENQAKIKEYARCPIRKEKARLRMQTPESIERLRAYSKLPRVKAKKKEYRDRPEVKLRAKAYRIEYKSRYG